jgi:hypothetical protein
MVTLETNEEMCVQEMFHQVLTYGSHQRSITTQGIHIRQKLKIIWNGPNPWVIVVLNSTYCRLMGHLTACAEDPRTIMSITEL